MLYYGTTKTSNNPAAPHMVICAPDTMSMDIFSPSLIFPGSLCINAVSYCVHVPIMFNQKCKYCVINCTRRWESSKDFCCFTTLIRPQRGSSNFLRQPASSHCSVCVCECE